jgi:UTP--glucose-1-phosphate uridylyltransferase
MKIRKAVIAVAGYGTRFLPATKVQPKELLPIVDKPIVQYLVEEVVASGIKDIVLVTRSGTQAIADHFDSSRELEAYLAEQAKREYLEIVQSIPKMANIAVVRQGGYLPYGNGTPILAAKSFLNEGQPFVYMFGDDLVMSDVPCVRQLTEAFMRHEPAAVVAAQEVPQSEIHRYGAMRLKNHAEPKELQSIIEKPSPGTAPSCLAQVGRFVLPWRIVEILEHLEVLNGDELYLTAAIDRLCHEARVLVHPIEGKWLTTGDPLNFLKTNVVYALRNAEIGRAFAEFLRNLKL